MSEHSYTNYTATRDSNQSGHELFDTTIHRQHENYFSSTEDGEESQDHDNITTFHNSTSSNLQQYTMDLEAELTSIPSILTSFHNSKNNDATRQRQNSLIQNNIPNSFSINEQTNSPIDSSSLDERSKPELVSDVQNHVSGIVPFHERHRYEFYTVIAGGVLLAFNSGLINGITLQARNVPVSHVSGKFMI